MDTRPNSFHPEALLEHAGWMRGLARSLVRDEGTADDLVQEAWLAALRRPPRDRGALRPWLARTLRNAARIRYRGGAARATREAAAAQEEALIGADERAECIEGQRILADLVSQLDEPYRGTVWQRYYKGLEPAEIARREGVPASSVRRRLSVALGRLREGLDRRYGGERVAWCHALAPLAGAPAAKLKVGAAAASLILGALTMKIVAFALVSTAAILLGLHALTSGAEEKLHAPVAAGPASSGQVGQASATPHPAAERESVKVTPLSTTELAATPHAASADDAIFDLRVAARILDEDGRPIAGAKASLVYKTYREATSDADGNIVLEFEQQGGGAGSLVVSAAGHAEEHIQVEFAMGMNTDLGDITLVRAGSVVGRVLDDVGNPVRGARVVAFKYRPGKRFEEERVGDPERLFGRVQIQSDEHGEFTLAGVPSGRWVIAAQSEGFLRSYSEPMQVEADRQLRGVELLLDRTPIDLVIAGVVLGEAGRAAPFAQVSLKQKTLSSSSSVMIIANRDGRFRHETETEGPFDLVARHSRNALGASRVGVHPGETQLELRLAPIPTAQVVVRSADGSPVPSYSVKVWTSFDLATGTKSGGSVHRRNQKEPGHSSFPLPLHSFLLEIESQGHRGVELGPLEPAHIRGPIEVVMQPRGEIRGRVFNDGAPVADAEGVVYGWVGPDAYRSKNGFNQVQAELDDTPAVRTDDEGAFALRVDLNHHVGRFSGSTLFVVQARAEGLAPAQSPPFGPDGPGQGFDLHLTGGGAIEGRVIDGYGHRYVAACAGDPVIESTRIGHDGSYRFENLKPGNWRVRVYSERWVDGVSGTSSGSNIGGSELLWDCVVVEGETTYHDIDLSAVQSHLRGQLIDPDGPGLWTSRLVAPNSSDDLTRLFYTSNDVDARGEFKLVAPQRGEHELRLTREGGGASRMEVSDRVDLYSRDEIWNLTWESAPLEGRVENLVLFEQLELWHVINPEGELWVYTHVQPDTEGGFYVRVPVGEGALFLVEKDGSVHNHGREHARVQVPSGGLAGLHIR